MASQARLGPTARIDVYQDAHDIVSHLPTVIAEVASVAKDYANDAQLLLERHRHSGDAHVVTTRTGVTDTLVSLDDEGGQWAALSIEFGRPRMKGRKGYMAGLHILGRTFGV